MSLNDSRLSYGRLLGAGLFVTLSLGMAAFFTYKQSEIERLKKVGIESAVLEGQRVDFGDMPMSRVRQISASNPLNADLLNLLYVEEEFSQTAGDDKQSAIEPILEQLGWRSTATQFALMFGAAKRDELGKVIDRVDALLRRDDLTEYAYTSLFLIESKPEFRSQLARSLANRPSWLGAFLARPEPLQSSEGRASRVALINALYGQKFRLKREELAPTVNALSRSGEYQAAFTLWSKFEPTQASRMLGDPKFSLLEQRDPERPDLAMPFEWQLGSGTGYQASLDDSVSVSQIRIEWDGRGVPVFLKQQMRAAVGKAPTLLIGGVDASSQLMRNLTVSAVCENEVVVFAPVFASNRANNVILQAEANLPCEFPELRVSGQNRSSGSALEFAISELSIR